MGEIKSLVFKTELDEY